MPKYTIELEGRDKDHPTSTCIVRDEQGVEIGEFSAVLTEVALLGALRVARAGGNQEIWATARLVENAVARRLIG